MGNTNKKNYEPFLDKTKTINIYNATEQELIEYFYETTKINNDLIEKILTIGSVKKYYILVEKIVQYYKLSGIPIKFRIDVNKDEYRVMMADPKLLKIFMTNFSNFERNFTPEQLAVYTYMKTDP